MPSPSTAYDLIKGAMRLIGAIAPGETPTAEEANDGLNALNDLLENWSTENLSVYGSSNQTFNTVGGQAVYTIGPAGNWNTNRPIDIDDAYCTVNGVDFQVGKWGQEEYNSVGLKTYQQVPVERFMYVNENPLGLVTLFPVPSQAIPITLTMNRILTSVPTLATSIVYPPGYMLAIKHALAILLAPDFGRVVTTEVLEVAKNSKADIKRANKTRRVATFDSALLPDGPAIWQRGY